MFNTGAMPGPSCASRLTVPSIMAEATSLKMRDSLAAAMTSPLAQRVALAVFMAIVFIEVVILVPSYLRREHELRHEIVQLGRELVQMEFSPDNANVHEEMREKAKELTQVRYMKGVLISADGKQLLREGDIGGVGLYAGMTPTDTIDGVPYRPIPAGRIEFLIPSDTFRLKWDVTLVADVSHIPNELWNYVLRIGGMVVVIALFVTLVTMLVLWRILLRQVLLLGEQMNRTGEQFTNPVDLPVALVGRDDEIGALFRAFSRMLETIQESVRAMEDLARFPSENPHPVFRTAPDGTVIYANEAARSHPDFLAPGFTQRVSEEIARSIRRAFAENRQQEFEFAAGGRILSGIAVPFLSQRYVNVYARDVTRLKRVESELNRKSADLAAINDKLMETMAGLELEIAKRTSDLVEANEALRVQMQIAAMAEDRFRAFAASAADWYWEMDKDLRFSYFSEDFEAVTGVPPEKLLGKTRQETAIPDVDDAEWRKHLDDLAHHRAFRNFVHPRRLPNGSTVYVSINGIPILDEDGTFYGYRGTGSDVTVIHEAAEELRRAKELAETAARAKSDFLATMSHEIRTPMNGIIGMAELLSETSLETDQRAYVDTVLSSATGLMQILDDILDLAKFESGQFDLERVPFALSELVEAVVEPISLQALNRGNNLAVIVDPELPRSVVGDPDRLRQVLLNLAGNAVKFTENGEITIEIVCQHRADGYVTVLFDVRDTGIGISSEDQGRLSKDFSQVDQSIMRRYGGAGLGLSISKRLVEIMGGTIGVTSEAGKGSSFRFTLNMPIAST